jgi:hypothetical protein
MLLIGSSVAAGSGAGAITREACDRPIVIARLAFGPGTVAPGQKSTARLSGRNCTRHPQTATIRWTGRYSGGGVRGCPVIDPLVQRISVPAAEALTAHLGFVVPRACTATALVVNTRVTDKAGTVISNKTASLRITHVHDQA